MIGYDYIVVGAGSAGCVLANRLSADPARRVLLLEAGGTDRVASVRIPAAFPRLFKGERDWDYVYGPEPAANDRALFLPRGRMLGGSSSMNAMIYIRGRARDYDGWVSSGATGWGWDVVLPLFKTLEDNERGADSYHGVGGELHVSDLRTVNPLTERFVESCVDAGIAHNPDFNGARQEGVGVYQVTQRRGRRWSAADAFLHPVRRRSNLTVETGALVHRIVLEGGRATGVGYVKEGEARTARAHREVVISAGVIGSPQILQLSGIGPADHLRSVGIEPVADLPDVGEHLQDHPVAMLVYRSTVGGTLDEATAPRHLLRYLLTRDGMLASNVGEGGAFVRTDSSLSDPDIQFHFGPAYFADHGLVPFRGNAFTLGPTLLTPAARGSVRIRSADPRVRPSVVGNHLSDAADVERLVAGIRLGRDIAGRGPLSAVRGEELFPGTGIDSGEDLAAYVRRRVELLYHPTSTCRIGPPGLGVVDARLRVHGVEGLRVADASVMPLVVGGNTNAASIMIGEQASRMIRAGD